MYLLLCCLYLSSIYYRSEAVSLTCADICPGTELTCTCSVPSDELKWVLHVPGSAIPEEIIFDNTDGVGSTITATNGMFAVVTDNTGGRKESMLTYTATESLVNGTIECAGSVSQRSVSITFAG